MAWPPAGAGARPRPAIAISGSPAELSTGRPFATQAPAPPITPATSANPACARNRAAQGPFPGLADTDDRLITWQFVVAQRQDRLWRQVLSGVLDDEQDRLRTTGGRLQTEPCSGGLWTMASCRRFIADGNRSACEPIAGVISPGSLTDDAGPSGKRAQRYGGFAGHPRHVGIFAAEGAPSLGRQREAWPTWPLKAVADARAGGYPRPRRREDQIASPTPPSPLRRGSHSARSP